MRERIVPVNAQQHYSMMHSYGMTAAEFLKALMERAGDNPNSLATRSKAVQSTIFRILEGTSLEPRSATREKLGRAFGVAPEAFLSEKVRMAEATRLGLLSKEDGAPLGAIEPTANTEPGPEMRPAVPLISWVQAGKWCAMTDPLPLREAEDWLPVPRKHGPRTFALRVRGISMEPKYRDGSIIFVDPDRAADHGCNVVVRLDNEKEATFKQLIIEGDRRFLKPLNPNWPEQLIPINGNATICGVVIGQFIPD